MSPGDLDRVDMGILHLLQRDARNVTTGEIAEGVNLSSSAVASRISALEDAGVITGYAPIIDYEAAGFDQHVLLRATATVDEQESIAEQVMDVPNVVGVTELMTDEGNVVVELVSPSQDRVEDAVERLNDLGLEVLQTEMIKEDRERAFDHFGQQYTTDRHD